MKKLLPYPLVCVDRIEEWLNKMALKGYHLIKLNSVFATFWKGEPKDTKYTVAFGLHNDEEDFFKDNIVDMDIYKEHGWQLFQDMLRCSVFDPRKKIASETYTIYRSTIDEPTIDIQKDRPSLADLAKIASRKSRLNFSMIIFVLPIIYYFAHYLYKYSHLHIFIDKFHMGMIRITPFILLLIFFIYKGIRLLQLKRYYKGKRLKLKWGIKSNLLLTIFLLVTCVFAGIYAGPEGLVASADDIYLGDIDNLVNLRVVEGDSTYLDDNSLDDYYSGYRNKLPFMPIRYLLSEYSYTMGYNNNSTYIVVVYTKSRFPSLLNRVFKLDNYYLEEIIYTSTPHFPEIMYSELTARIGINENQNHYVLMFHNDYELIEITYRGHRTPEEIIENVEALFASDE